MLKDWWNRRGYDFKGGIIGLAIAVLSVIFVSELHIFPGGLSGILGPRHFGDYVDAYGIIVLYYTIITLLGILIGFIIGKVIKKN